ncbi:MAG: hypothetical protein M3Y41_17640 [Pseudomonadota bacterium]|nr:hypothetical protein [Pseudomonadota bacterium]
MSFTPLVPNLIIDAQPMLAAIGDAIAANSVILTAQAYVGQGVAPDPTTPADWMKPRISLAVPSIVPDRTYDDNALRMLVDIAVTTQGRDTTAVMALAVAVQDVALHALTAPVGFTLYDVTILGMLERDPPPIADQFVRVRVVNTKIWFTKN